MLLSVIILVIGLNYGRVLNMFVIQSAVLADLNRGAMRLPLCVQRTLQMSFLLFSVFPPL